MQTVEPELFDVELPGLPSWLPDETLFSLLSRFHVLSGNRLPCVTRRNLFGAGRLGWQHDFPTGLAQLSLRTGGRLGDAEELALQRTLLPFYLPLQPPLQAQEAIAALSGGSAGMLKFRLGILTSRFRAHHPLKACPECMSSDQLAWGTTYWHLNHQFPGVWQCSRHSALLLESTVKSTGVERFGWALPRHGTLSIGDRQSREATASLGKLGDLVSRWTRRSRSRPLTATALAASYRAAVNEKFGARGLEPSQRNAMTTSLCDAVAPLRAIAELRAFPSSPETANAQIQRWILAPRGGTHPLRHLALIFWLFRDWEHFERTLGAGSGDHQVPERDCSTPDSRRLAFISALEEGQSATAAARDVGITTNTGMAWAASAGFATRRRSKSVDASARQDVIAGLRRGEAKRALAGRCEVSVQTVTRVLQTEPGIRSLWEAAKASSLRESHQRSWIRALETFGGLPLTLLRREAPAAYAWLYRHDRQWLDQHRPNVVVPRGNGGSRTDWDRRDIALSADVRRLASEIASASTSTRVELWQIYQRLPELKAKLGSLHRLPLTIQAIRDSTGRRRTAKGQRLL